MKTKASTVAVAAANGIANISPNPRRHAIILSQYDGKAFAVQIGTQPDSTHGILITTTIGYLSLCVDEYGTGIRDAITLIDKAGSSVTFVYTEFLIAE